MTDFPRGWTLSTAVGPGTAASITLPAIDGVVHVLDDLLAQLQNFTGANSFAAEVDVVISTGTVVRLGIAIPAAIGMADESLSGLSVASSVGGTLVVQFGAVGPAGITEYLTIQGHDI